MQFWEPPLNNGVVFKVMGLRNLLIKKDRNTRLLLRRRELILRLDLLMRKMGIKGSNIAS